jgi:hypothetical protein
VSDPVAPPPRPLLSIAQLDAIRAHHRGTRNAGLVACLLGVLILIAGRYMAGAPVWLISVGVGVVALGWGLIAFAQWKRVAMARALTSKPGASKVGG